MEAHLIWVIAGIILVIVELLTGTFYLLVLGVAAWLTRQDAAAREELTRAVDLDPTLLDARRLLGQAAYRMGDILGAISVYDALLARAAFLADL